MKLVANKTPFTLENEIDGFLVDRQAQSFPANSPHIRGRKLLTDNPNVAMCKVFTRGTSIRVHLVQSGLLSCMSNLRLESPHLLNELTPRVDFCPKQYVRWTLDNPVISPCCICRQYVRLIGVSAKQ